MKIETLRTLENLIPFEQSTFSEFIESLCSGFENVDQKVATMTEEVGLTIFEGMKLDELFEAAILAAAQNIQNDIEYDKLASRLLLTRIYKDSLRDLGEKGDDFQTVYRNNFIDYIKYGVEEKLLNPDLLKLFDLEDLADSFKFDNDDKFMFIGLSTLEQRYAIRDRKQNLLETPQFSWMRVAMGLALAEENPSYHAKRFYNKLSNLEYIPGGSTNIGAGTTYSVLSNCYLLDTEDDIHSIFDNVKNIAIIAKATGGIGISVSKLRGAGSPVRSNNTMSTGPIPFIKVMDSALKSMSRAGKKYGAMCIYMENWHINFPEFIDLRQNAGDDYRRVRTADTAVYISDEFMKRVINDDEWYLFNPLDAQDLTELYGSEFSKRYTEYIEMAKNGEIAHYKKVPAREQMKQILTSLQGTSHPWLTWKDNINLRALNNNTGTIHCSNLCTEICLPQDRENIAVCNLAYINLTQHVKEDGASLEDRIDWENLEDTVRVLMRHLDNLVEVNQSPLAETKNSDENNRAVGMGMSGFSEVLEKLGVAYDSTEAYDLMDRISEFVSYISIDESCNLADERGAYPNFKGSMWSKGFVPFDTIDVMAKDRLWDQPATQESKAELSTAEQTNIVLKNSLNQIKDKIQTGLDKATSDESKNLYEIFNQLTTLLESNSPKAQENSSTADAQNLSVTVETESYNAAGQGIGLRQDRSSRMNWDKLRERIKQGVRNATTMAIAPNASTGLVLGTSPGIDPRFAQIFSRSTYAGKFLDINHNLVKDLQKLGIWEDVSNKVLENYGDISQIEEIPDELKAVYKTSFQVSPYAYIEVASRAQKWIDQSLSRNMYLETRDIDEMIEIYTEAWRRGLKTTYYLHVKPRHSSEQSTVKVNKSKNMNKSGFAMQQKEAKIEAKHTAQEPLVGSRERKGFGFVEVKTEEKHKFTQGLKSSTGGGFSSIKTEKTEEMAVMLEKQSFKPTKSEKSVEKRLAYGQACPLDPAEREQCEACQ